MFQGSPTYTGTNSMYIVKESKYYHIFSLYSLQGWYNVLWLRRLVYEQSFSCYWCMYFMIMNCLFINFFIFFRVAVSRSKDVPPFGPNIPAGAKFGKQKAFADFLLTKGEECSSFYRNWRGAPLKQFYWLMCGCRQKSSFKRCIYFKLCTFEIRMWKIWLKIHSSHANVLEQKKNFDI